MAAMVVLLCIYVHPSWASETKTIHVFVALADNENQGIVPVPGKLGDGMDPKNNLYWGALYGVKTYFMKSRDWTFVKIIMKPDGSVLERAIFKHKNSNVYLIADAYRGDEIKKTIMDFLNALAERDQESLTIEVLGRKVALRIGGASDMIAYVGHNGLMDFELSEYPSGSSERRRDAIILACISKPYFSRAIQVSGANPLLWTTGLMAPEAYTLEAAIEGWLENETGEEIRLRAAKAYNRYQKCGLNASKRLLVTDSRTAR
jgi:hypothetical protein